MQYTWGFIIWLFPSLIIEIRRGVNAFNLLLTGRFTYFASQKGTRVPIWEGLMLMTFQIRMAREDQSSFLSAELRGSKNRIGFSN
jgi:hypothetical protein